MSNKFVLDADPGHVQYYHHDPLDEDKLILEDVYDVEPIINEAKRLSEMNPGREFRHVGIIPPHVLDQAAREGWINDQKKWREWLNDPDNRAFRTHPGRV